MRLGPKRLDQQVRHARDSGTICKTTRDFCWSPLFFFGVDTSDLVANFGNQAPQNCWGKQLDYIDYIQYPLVN